MELIMNLLTILIFNSIRANQTVKENYNTSCLSLVTDEKGKGLVIAKHPRHISAMLSSALQNCECHLVKGGAQIL